MIFLSLFKLAERINGLAKAINVNKIELGKKLIEVQKRVARESNMTFNEWCKNYIKKPDGTPFHYSTLSGYMHYARYPKRAVDKKKKDKTRYNARRNALAIALPLFTNNTTDEEQLNLLVRAWEAAGANARNRFMEVIREGK